MKHLLLSFLFCIPFILTAQHKTHVEMNYGYFKNNIILQLEDENSQGYFNFRELQVGQNRPSAFLGITHKLNKHISLKSGMEFQLINYKVPVLGLGIDGRSLSRGLISIPVLGKVNLLPNKTWHPYFETGIIYSLVFNETEKISNTNGTTTMEISRGFRSLNYDPSLFFLASNIGLVNEYSSGSELFIQLSTSFQLDLIRQFGISERMYNIGVNIGFRIPIGLNNLTSQI